MSRNYNVMEIEEIIRDLTSNPESKYHGLVYDERQGGYVKGPCKIPVFGVQKDLVLSSSQALLRLRQPISRNFQVYPLIVEKGSSGWEIKRLLDIIEEKGK